MSDGPLQVAGQVLSTKRVGAYHHLTLVAPGIAERTRPGHFVALATGGPDGELTIVERILEGEVDMVVNTPSGPRARADGYEIRAAAIAMDRPIITTVQQLAAAVQGIEALGRGTLDVRSIQDWTAALREATGGSRS